MKKNGFTLIELMIVVAILGLLASVALPLAEVTVQRGKEADLRRTLREVRTAIDAYKRAADDGRVQKSATGSGYPPSLLVLVEGAPDTTDKDGGKIYFLRRLPRDPVTGEEFALRSYASSPENPQAGQDVYDLYSKSIGTGLNGVPYKDW